LIRGKSHRVLSSQLNLRFALLRTPEPQFVWTILSALRKPLMVRNMPLELLSWKHSRDSRGTRSILQRDIPGRVLLSFHDPSGWAGFPIYEIIFLSRRRVRSRVSKKRRIRICAPSSMLLFRIPIRIEVEDDLYSYLWRSVKLLQIFLATGGQQSAV